VFLSGPPTCGLGDLAGAEGSAGINAKVSDAQERGEGIHRAGAFSGEFVAGGQENLCCRADAVVLPWGAELIDREGQYGGGDPT
jgi:hypothetical protein